MWSSSSASTRASAPRGVFSVEIADERPGLLVFRVEGQAASDLFKDEAGGHRWQRIPPTEKRGRVQTSTVTVAVMPEPTETEVRLDERDLDWTACRGSGPGGQARNKVNSAVQITHRPSGIQVRCESERSQHQNRRTALAMLRAKLWEREHTRISGAEAEDRRRQLGSGMRGDKRRTIRCQDGQVHDHVSGRRWRLKDYLRGEW